MAVNDRNANVGIRRMGQVRHMKTLFRRGLNAASGSVPAGTRIKFIRMPRARR